MTDNPECYDRALPVAASTGPFLRTNSHNPTLSRSARKIAKRASLRILIRRCGFHENCSKHDFWGGRRAGTVGQVTTWPSAARRESWPIGTVPEIRCRVPRDQILDRRAPARQLARDRGRSARPCATRAIDPRDKPPVTTPARPCSSGPSSSCVRVCVPLF